MLKFAELGSPFPENSIRWNTLIGFPLVRFDVVVKDALLIFIEFNAFVPRTCGDAAYRAIVAPRAVGVQACSPGAEFVSNTGKF